MEYVFRPNITLTEYQIEQLYYAALDIATERQTSWTASAVFPEPFVAGNKPRALLLNFGFDNDGLNSNTYMNGGFDPLAYNIYEYWVTRETPDPQLTFTNDRANYGGFVRDAVTDEPVLLDPRTIPNISKYDIIQVVGYPETSDQILTLIPQSIDGTGYDYQENLGKLEQFVSRLREIVDTYGTSLLVTSVRLSVDLGIVDDVESVSQFYESRFSGVQSNQNSGLYDYRSAQIDPMLNPNGIGTGTDLTGREYSYFDTHRNNRLRIVATQTGLTDVQGGWTLEDVVTSIPRDPLALEEFSYKYKDTRNGLAIGDKMYIHGLQTSRNELGTASGDTYGIYSAREPFYAFPSSAVKTGTIIAKLDNTYWDGTIEKTNPFADYAAAIVVNPGDSLKGTAVGGKIYVDVTNRQDTRYTNVATFQTTDVTDENYPIPGISSAIGTAYERQWQYSTGRLSLTGSPLPITGSQTAKNPQAYKDRSGSTTTSTTLANGADTYTTFFTNQLVQIIVDEKYPTIQVYAPSLLERGIAWLKEKIVVNPNDKTIRPEAMIAEALHKDSGLYINKDIVTNAASMVSNVYLVEPDNVTSVDARIVVLPLAATARITGYSRRIEADPMTASAILNTDSVTFAGGEQVVVTLHEVQTVDLYMKEEAY